MTRSRTRAGLRLLASWWCDLGLDRGVRGVWIIGATLTVMMSSVVLGQQVAPVAHAETCVGSVSDFSWGAGPNVIDGRFESRMGGIATLRFRWSVIDGAHANDTFTLELPPQVRREQTLSSFWLDAPSGEHVAKVTWNGRTTIFTLTDYVETHSSVSGEASFSIDWESTTPSGDHMLSFRGCNGGGDLPARLLPEPPPGYFQMSGKSGSVNEIDKDIQWWVGMNSATDGNIYTPITFHDPGGPGYTLSCTDLTIANRTPPPYTRIDDTNYIDPNRYTCTEDGHGGIDIIFHTDRWGVSMYKDETMMVTIFGKLTPDFKDWDRLHNVATVTNGPIEQVDEIPGYAEVPSAGGSGSGIQVDFTIQKAVIGAGQPDPGTSYTFEYKCFGDDFMPLDPVTFGQTTNSVKTKSSARCTIREVGLKPGVTVRYEGYS